jgi:hypothetical protein
MLKFIKKAFKRIKYGPWIHLATSSQTLENGGVEHKVYIDGVEVAEDSSYSLWFRTPVDTRSASEDKFFIVDLAEQRKGTE